MAIWIALFRGINVGGNNLLTMKELRTELETLGLTDVQTYIQSGNVVFRSSGRSSQALAKKIRAKVETGHGFSPRVLVLGCSDLEAAIASNPFPEAEATPSLLHVCFLETKATSPDLDAMRAMSTPSERFLVTDEVVYLHTPDGIARSKLAANVEKCLGVAATARNWRTVQKLLELARSA